MQELLRNIIKKVQRKSGDYGELDLIQGLDNQEVNTLQEEFSVQFPADYQEALQLYGKTVDYPGFDGYVIGIPHFGEMLLMTEQQLITAYRLLLQLEPKPCAHNVEKLEDIFWSPQWIPMAEYAGFVVNKRLGIYHMMVLDESSQLYGKIIGWDYRSGPTHLVAESFKAYMVEFDRALNSTGLSWDETYGFSF